MTVIALLLVGLTGWLLISALGLRLHPLERVAAGWCLGISSITFCLFVASACGIALSSVLVWCTLGASLLVALAVAHSRTVPRVDPARRRQHYSPLQVWTIVVVLLFAFLVIVQGNYWPVYDNDSLSTYDFRARLMVAEGTLNVSAYQKQVLGGGRFYPPLVPLSYVLVYLTGGSQPKIITTLFWLSLVAIVYCRLWQHVTRLPALVFSLLVVLSPQLLLYATHGMTNIPFAALVVAAVLYLLEWYETEQQGFFWLGAVLLAGAAWTRSADALLLAGILWFWVLLRGPMSERVSMLSWIAGGLLIVGPAFLWQTYVVSVIGFPAFAGPGGGELQLYISTGRLWETALALVVQLLDPRVFGLGGIGFALGIVLALVKRDRLRATALLEMIALLLLAWTSLFYLIELESRYNTLYNSGQRLLMAYAPILVCFAGRQEALTRALEHLDTLSWRWWNGTS